MVSVTVSIPEEIREIMGKFPEINWSGLVRRCIEEKARELSWKEEMLNKLKVEEQFDNWAVSTVRAGRKERLQELKKKGLV